VQEAFRSTEIEALGEVHASVLERRERGCIFDALGNRLLVQDSAISTIDLTTFWSVSLLVRWCTNSESIFR